MHADDISVGSRQCGVDVRLLNSLMTSKSSMTVRNVLFDWTREAQLVQRELTSVRLADLVATFTQVLQPNPTLAGYNRDNLTM